MSDLGHAVVGVLLLVAALSPFVQTFGRRSRGAVRLVWPSLVGLSGLFLLLYLLFPHHGAGHASAQWRWVLTDTQQRQHVAFGLLALLGAIAELGFLLRGNSRRLQLVWPAGLLLAAVIFLSAHPQHGTPGSVRDALVAHQLIGGLLLATGIFRGSELVAGAAWLGRVWPLTLLGAAILLVGYREPVDAYGPTPTDCLTRHRPAVRTASADSASQPPAGTLDIARRGPDTKPAMRALDS